MTEKASAGTASTGTASADVTVIVVTWQGRDLLPACLDSLAAQTMSARVLVIDNASTDGTTDLLCERYPWAQVHRLDSNTGFAGGVHAALPLIRTPLVALLNNDARADPDWLAASGRALSEHPDAVAVTAKMLLWTDPISTPPIINNAGVRLTERGYGTDRGGGEPDGPAFADAVEVFGFSGGAAVLRTDAVLAVGGMPAEFFLYYEDTDLAWRLRLSGHRIYYAPEAVVWHRHAASTDRMSESFAYFNERNRLLLLLRCAPLTFALGQLARFVVTTGSLMSKRLRRQQVADAAVFRTRLRVRVLIGVAGQLGWALRSRRIITATAVRDRRAIVAEWVPGRGQLS
ncbi:glycosyltransferase family 2 protein [soil metagenome]|jgi:GT2 family glycosyltransferase